MVFQARGRGVKGLAEGGELILAVDTDATAKIPSGDAWGGLPDQFDRHQAPTDLTPAQEHHHEKRQEEDQWKELLEVIQGLQDIVLRLTVHQGPSRRKKMGAQKEGPITRQVCITRMPPGEASRGNTGLH